MRGNRIDLTVGRRYQGDWGSRINNLDPPPLRQATPIPRSRDRDTIAPAQISPGVRKLSLPTIGILGPEEEEPFTALGRSPKRDRKPPPPPPEMRPPSLPKIEIVNPDAEDPLAGLEDPAEIPSPPAPEDGDPMDNLAASGVLEKREAPLRSLWSRLARSHCSKPKTDTTGR